MAGPDDAIAHAQAAHASASEHEDAKANQLAWARAESVTLTRRFVDSLQRAGYQPLQARRLRLAYSPQQVRVGTWPSRRKRTECAWTQSSRDIGEAWPILGQQWATLAPDRGGGDSGLFRPGMDI